MSFLELKSIVQKHDQEHLLQFWNEISDEEKELLTQDIINLDFPKVTSYFKKVTSSNESKKHFPEDKLGPIPSSRIESSKTCSCENLEKYETLGLEAISKGKVAVILLAGGQGTRLGFDYPKGMFNVNLPSNRTLFHIQALRIKKLQNLAEEKRDNSQPRKDIAWYIMTSDATHEDTLKYFEKNQYFGLNKNNIIVFKQSTLPCFTFDGKIILNEKHRVSKAPDGNGGLYASLKKEGILDDMERRGITSVHAYCVDNILVKVADPIFLGYCISKNADCGAKAVKKRSSDEPVGVICSFDGRYTVVEYCEISPETAKLTDDKGELVYSAGNICNHYFKVGFLRKISEKHENDLDIHAAKKKIPFVDNNGVICKPNSPNGIKIEKFVFDVFKYSENFVVYDVVREDEFSAVKNSDSAKIDCASTARNDVLNLHKKWLLKAGASEVEGDVEICPLLSYAGENLSPLANNKAFKGPLLLE